MAEERKLKFERGQSGADDLKPALSEISAELRDPTSEAAADAARIGIDPAEAADAQLTVSEEAQGIDPVTAAILIGIATNLASDAVEKLWDAVILPRLKRRLGAKVLGRRVE
jgi:hypothetical protein